MKSRICEESRHVINRHYGYFSPAKCKPETRAMWFCVGFVSALIIGIVLDLGVWK